MRVVVVEDDPDIALMVRMAFRDLDLDLIVEPFDQIPPSRWENADVALLDYMLPHVTGCDLAHQARAANPNIRIVMWTAYEIPEDCQALCDRVLRKPASFNDLMAAFDGR